jgi:hypothetical protein
MYNNPFGWSFRQSQDRFPRAYLNVCAVLGALLGTQNGREVDIVNSFELAVEVNDASVNHGFLVSRRDQCR